MSDDLRDLYQTVILDHYKKPRNQRCLEGADCSAEGVNPLCGDRVKVYARRDGDRVADVSFEGSGCAISTASASIMTEIVKGRSRADVEQLFGRFQDAVMGKAQPDAETLGKLEVLTGVREFPARVKCAILAWHALRSALASGETVSTE